MDDKELTYMDLVIREGMRWVMIGGTLQFAVQFAVGGEKSPIRVLITLSQRPEHLN